MRLNLFASLLLASAQIVFAQRYPAYMSDLAKEDAQGVFTGGTDAGKVKTGADATAHRVNDKQTGIPYTYSEFLQVFSNLIAK